MYISTSGGSRINERGFQWRRRSLAMVVLTRKNGAVAREARHLGGAWGMPP